MPRILSESEFNAVRDRVLSAAPDGLDETSFHRYVGPAMAQAIGEAENQPSAPVGSASGRFLSNAASVLNPITAATGALQALRHPFDTYYGAVNASADQFTKASDAFHQGRYSEGLGHGAAALLPGVGPAAAATGEQIGTGDVAGGLGRGVTLAALPVATGAVPGMMRAVARMPVRAPLAATLNIAGAALDNPIAGVLNPKLPHGGKILTALGDRIANPATKTAPMAQGFEQYGGPSVSGYTGSGGAGIATDVLPPTMNVPQATYTQLEGGGWGLKGTGLREGETANVTNAAGTPQLQTVGKILRDEQGVQHATIGTTGAPPAPAYPLGVGTRFSSTAKTLASSPRSGAPMLSPARLDEINQTLRQRIMDRLKTTQPNP